MKHVFLAAITVVLMTAALPDRPAFARDDYEVVYGNVVITHDGQLMLIHAGNNSIIEWAQFNIDHDEIVRFIQPHELARVLNRITGPDPSHIDGKLLANGIVYIVNPAGVYFGQNSFVDVGGIYAAGSSLSNARFLNGKDLFDSIEGSIVNEGVIRGDAVHLIGKHVSNYGTILAEHGIVTLLAGDTVYLGEDNGRIWVKIDGKMLTDQDEPHGGGASPDLLATPGVENTGTIKANHGRIVFGAGDVYGLAIRNTGRVRAKGGEITAAAAGGVIHNTGTLSADIRTGEAGTVVVQAPSIVNAGRITADARSGRAGSVEVTSRNHTYLLEGSRVSAAGKKRADGGDVLVHSYDGLTVFDAGAMIDVSGGKKQGDAGFAELSGKDLAMRGRVKLKAREGYELGTLLIDPDDIFILDSGVNDALLDDNEINFNEPPGEDLVFVSDTALEMLEGTVRLQALRDIIFKEEVEFEHDNVALTLEANRFIIFDRGVRNTVSLDVFADVDGDDIGLIAVRDPLIDIGDATFSGHAIYLDANGLGGADLISGNNLTFNEKTILLTNSTVHGSESVSFLDTINSQSGELNNLTVNSPATLFAGDIGMGAGGGLGFLRTDAAGVTTVGGDVRALKIRFNDAVELAGDSTMFADSAYFFDSIEGHSNDLSIMAVDTRFLGDISGVGTLMTDAAGETRVGGDVQADNVNFNDAVVLVDDVEISADEVDFGATIDGRGNDLQVDAVMTRFGGDVTDIGALVTDSAGVTRLEGDLEAVTITLGDVVELADDIDIVGESVTFGATVDSVDGKHELTVHAEELVSFGDDVGEAGELAALEVSAALIELRGGGRVTVRGDILFNAQGADSVPTIATIAAPDGSVLIVSRKGRFVMGRNQKMTALGDLVIDVKKRAEIGDLSALDDIVVIAGSIRIVSRDPGKVLDFTGALLSDSGADFVAGDSISFSVKPKVIGNRGQVTFATSDGDGDVRGTLGGFIFRSLGSRVTKNTLVFNPVLDLRSDGASTADIAEALAGAAPNDSRLNEVEDRIILSRAELAALRRLAVDARELSELEYAEMLNGRDIYFPTTALGVEQVAVNRMLRAAVLRAIRAHDAFFGSFSDYDLARIALEDAWVEYIAELPEDAEASAAAFGVFLEDDPEHAEAVAALAVVRGIYREMLLFGLNEGELTKSARQLLNRLRPEPMDEAIMLKLISEHADR